MNYLKIAFGVLIALSASRFIPHPPNFTSLLALSFYIPAVFGIRFIPIVVLALLFTDLIIGFHSTMFFTMGSVVLIGIMSKFFNKSMLIRIFGALGGALDNPDLGGKPMAAPDAPTSELPATGPISPF